MVCLVFLLLCKLSYGAPQVDDRLGGEGTGKVLGSSGAGEQYAIIGVFGLIWALYYAAGRDLGGDKGDDSGLTL